MDDRHLHFNILSGIWLMFFLMVIVPVFRYILTTWHIPGLSELFVYSFGSV
jgi:hypothetical protein